MRQRLLDWDRTRSGHLPDDRAAEAEVVSISAEFFGACMPKIRFYQKPT
jgi:hypothetical protein